MVHIELRGVHVTLGDVHVLRGVDLTIPSGEWLGVLGSSGSGKSTLLRTIVGLEAPERGRVLLDGEDATNVPARSRGLAMVAQGAPLMDHLSVRGNVEFPLRLRKVARDERSRRVWAELKAFGLSRLAERSPRHLSTGERHAAATAHSTVRVPRGLLLDEPVSALDAAAKRDVLAQVRAIHEGSGATLVVATNDRIVAAQSQRVAVLDAGRMAQVATLAHLHDEPATVQVGDLTGAWPLNRLTATTRAVAGRRVEIATPAGILRVWRPDLASHEHVVVGIRPSELEVVEPTSDDDQVLAGRVTSVATLGHVVAYEVDAGGEDLVATSPRQTHDVGHDVRLRPRRLHLFHRDGHALAHVQLGERR